MKRKNISSFSFKDVEKFYQIQAKLIWNGKELNGRDEIAKHLISLPSTRHNIYSLDFFPMKGKTMNYLINKLLSNFSLDLFPNEATTYQVFISGAVAYGTLDKTSNPKEKRLFSHIFVLTVDVNSSVWVVANECFRFHE